MAQENISDRGVVLGWNPFMKWGVVQVESGGAQVVVQANDLDPESGLTDLEKGATVDIDYRYERSGAYEYRANRVRPLGVSKAADAAADAGQA